MVRERRRPILAEAAGRGASERPPNPALGWKKRRDCCQGEDGATLPDVRARLSGGAVADGTELALYLVCGHPCGIRSCFGHVTIWDPAVEKVEDGWVYTLDETLGCDSPAHGITFTWHWSEWGGAPLPVDLKGLAVKVKVSVMSCCGLAFVHESQYDYPETPPGPTPEPPEPPDLGPI